MTSDTELAIAELLDRQAIHDCLIRYSRGVDRLDRDLLLSVYHHDAVDDHGMFVGGPEQFADWVIDMHSSMHLSQQHVLMNHSCDLSGSVAHTETYYMFVGMNRQGPPVSISGGRYVDRFEKRGVTWRITHRVCVRDWIVTDERVDLSDPAAFTAVKSGLSAEIATLMGSATQSTRDRSDASYARPLVIPDERLKAAERAAG
jgi:hypothetical protein